MPEKRKVVDQMKVKSRSKRAVYFLCVALGAMIIAICQRAGITAYGNEPIEAEEPMEKFNANDVYDNDALILGSDMLSYYYSNYHKASEYGLKAKKLNISGSSTLLIMNVKKEITIDIKVTTTIKSGKFKTVLCSPDNKVKTISQGNTNKLYKITLAKGRNVIKMVGRECEATNVVIQFSNIDKDAVISRYSSEQSEDMDTFRKECRSGAKIDIDKLKDFSYYLTKKDNAEFMIQYIKENKSVDEDKLYYIMYYADKKMVSEFLVEQRKSGKKVQNNLMNKLAYYLDEKCISQYLAYVADHPDKANSSELRNLFYYANSSSLNKSIVTMAKEKKKIEPDFIKIGAYYLSEEAIGAGALSVATYKPKQAVSLLREVAYYMDESDVAAVLNKLLDAKYEIKKNDISYLEYYLKSADYKAILNRMVTLKMITNSEKSELLW